MKRISFSNVLLALLAVFIVFYGCSHKNQPLAPDSGSHSSVIKFDKYLGWGDFDDPRVVIQTADEGYVIGANIESGAAAGYDDFCFIKTDKYGVVSSYKNYGGSSTDTLFDMRPTSDGGYIMTGITSSFGPGGSYVVKVDSEGDCQWTMTYPNTSAYAGAQTPDGGYVLAGGLNSSSDIYVMKLDSAGNCINSRSYPTGVGGEKCYSMEPAKDGGYIITGMQYYQHIYLLKLDSNFNKTWDKSYISPGNSEGHHIINADDTGFVLTGYTDYDTRDIETMKVDSLGNQIWSDIRGQTGTVFALYDEGYWVSKNSDNGYVVAGYGQNQVSDYNSYNAAYMMRYSSNGGLIWRKMYGGTYSDERIGRCAVQTKDGGFVLVGLNNGIFILKADADGNTL